MIARLICRRRGHELERDPGDFVLYCRRCRAMVDLADFRRVVDVWFGGVR